MKNYIVKLETTTVKDRAGVSNKLRAELDIDDEMDFSEIKEFTKQVKTIWKKAMQASKRGDYIEIEVVQAAYDGGVDELKQDLMQEDFDRWSFHGKNPEPDGIYLTADPRCTCATRDMFLSKNIMEDLRMMLGF